jgi:hypothetical protein
MMSRDSSATHYELEGRGSVPCKRKISLFSTASIPALGPTLLPIQFVLEDPIQGVKQPRCDTDYSHSYSAEVKNDGAPLPYTSSWHSA